MSATKSPNDIYEKKMALLERRLAGPSNSISGVSPTQLTKSIGSTDVTMGENVRSDLADSKSDRSDEIPSSNTLTVDRIMSSEQNGSDSNLERNPMIASSAAYEPRIVFDLSEDRSRSPVTEDEKIRINSDWNHVKEDASRKRSLDVCNDNSNDGGSNISEGGRLGKYSRASEDNSNIDVINTNHQENGSRGSGPKQVTLKAYFVPQEKDHAINAQTTVTSPISSNPAADISPGKEQVHPNQSKKEGKSSSAKTQNQSTGTSKLPQVSMTLPNTNVQQLQITILEMKRQVEQLRSSKEQSDAKVNRLEVENSGIRELLKKSEEGNTRLCKYLELVSREMAFQDARRKRDKLALDCVRLGKIATVRGGPSFNVINEVWEEGYAIKELNKRWAEHIERKDELEKRKKRLAQQKRQAKKTTTSIAAASAIAHAVGSSLFASSIGTVIASNSNTEEDDGELDIDMVAEAEAIRYHQDQLKREEVALSEERKLLESEKASHQKELKRCQFEERSRFYRDLPCLNSRYLLLSMLGRGGFSEVWKALDLLELKEVAVKVHQLNPSWTEDRKSSYIKHVTREYTIHRDLKHIRVVQLFDVFEIDVNSFATVLEYCKGIDLDEKLKRQRVIPEKEAKTIILQILCGLKYLNTPSSSTDDDSSGNGDHLSNISSVKRKAIIHFDLKPANILFDEMGDAKITDFGLSKIIDDVDDNTSLELTSQGAGTYWYLPPECFGKDGPPRISSKVDVWSLGVILYQMLYGKRPFGEGKSQEKVLSEGIILNANRVEFPVDPKGIKISDEAKDFIRACLTADQRYRPDVFTLCQHSYLRSAK